MNFHFLKILPDNFGECGPSAVPLKNSDLQNLLITSCYLKYVTQFKSVYLSWLSKITF